MVAAELVPPQVRTVVLVEGVSDRRAIERLAARQDLDLDSEGISIVSIEGSKNIGRFLERFGPSGLDVRLAGLCDIAEERDFRLGLERAGLGSDLTLEDMEHVGFFVCDTDLEQELIRALGADAVERVIEAQGELASLRTLQRQPAQRDRTREEQLHRFMGTQSGRKLLYAGLLVDTLEPGSIPRPLDRLLAHVLRD